MSLAKPQQRPHFITSQPLPEMGIRAVSVSWTFTSTFTTVTDDFTLENENGLISGVQSVYVDNGTNSFAMILTFNETGQTIYIAPWSQGYYPVLCHQSVSYTLSVYAFIAGATIGLQVNLQFLNVEVNPTTWTSQNTYPFALSVTNAGNALLTNSLSLATLVPPAQILFVTGFDVTGTGATAAGSVAVTLTNIVKPSIASGATLSWQVGVPALAQGQNVNFGIRFAQPLQVFGGQSTSLSVPAMGAGQTAASSILYGFAR